MKRFLTIFALCGVWLSASAQESMEKVMEKRTREMHRVICLTNKAEWTKFVEENFSQALINKPMRAEVKTDDGESGNSSSETIDNVDAKAGMFQHLNSDFGKSKITSLKQIGSSIEMVLKNDGGMSGAFVIKFETKQPYLIDGLAIEVIAGD